MQDPVEHQRSTFDAFMRQAKIANTRLAQLTGLRESTFRNFRNGTTRDMNLETKLKIANALDKPLDEIFGPTMNLTQRGTVAPATSTTTGPHDSSQTMVPIYGRADNGKLINTPYPVAFVEAPSTLGLAQESFAVRIINQDMMPRFRMREVLIANPDEGAPVHDDCVIITKTGEIHILHCLEFTPDRGFVGYAYANPQTKVSIKSPDISRIGRVAYIRT
ncbi:helix-turn-helix transcriptional regulator [Thalassospira xiamenensis]|uniref:helix-turn-helix domain-containing protein n=1 Tax=Thalassospira xiamenensis TaxID=220697 RepID=UPI0015F035E6|nr:helix-turn-helix domain-containing protein [Thalassospira xiamenensis]